MREYVFGPFRVNIPYCQLLREGQLVPLTPKAFDTLVFLIGHRDHVVSKEELMAAVWPNLYVSEDTLTHNILAIRRALSDDPKKQEFIATVPRRGYRFMAAVVEKDAESETEVISSAAEQSASASGVEPASSDVESPSGQTTTAAESVDGTIARAPRSGPAIDWRRSWYAAAVAASLVAAVWAVTEWRRERVQTGPRGLMRFTQASPRGATLISGGQLSPDGSQLAFVAQDERTGRTQVWLRSLDAAAPQPLPGTEGASRPFWSPDGRYIGFFADGSLRRVALWKDEPRALAPVVSIRPAGASWGSSDQILFATSSRSGLLAVPASGGEPRPASTLNVEAHDVGHRWPHFLPDGRHFLYSVVSGDSERSGIYVAELDSDDPHVRVLDGLVVSAIYASPGYLLYVRDGLLMAHPFDESTLRLRGDAVSLASNVRSPGLFSDTVLSASAGGLLTFGGDTFPERLVWVDRTGNQLRNVDVALVDIAFSPDGKQLIGSAVSSGMESGGIWLLDLEQGVPTRIAENGMAGLWAPDGSRIAYSVPGASGQPVLQVRSVTSPVRDFRLWESDRGGLLLNSWSPDQRYIVYGFTEGKRSLSLLATSGAAKATPYSRPSRFNQTHGQVSPDGQTIAFASDETGIWEIYVDSFPTPGARRRISVDGGIQPQWSRSGAELFYLALDKTLMSVDFSGGQAERPQPLFKAPVWGPLANYRNHYAVAPDGRRFLFSVGTEEPITIVLNWAAGLE